jgi:hypothetical protein
LDLGGAQDFTVVVSLIISNEIEVDFGRGSFTLRDVDKYLFAPKQVLEVLLVLNLLREECLRQDTTFVVAGESNLDFVGIVTKRH